MATQLKSDALMEQMKLHMSSDAGKELTKKIGLVYQINIAPKKLGFNEKCFVVDLKKGEVKEGHRGRKQERHLVATIGKFSVIWNFQQVKDGSHACYQNQLGLKSCYCYKVVLKDDSIVDSRFMHDKFAVSDSPEAPVVVETPMRVSSFSISSRRLQM